MAIKVGNGSAVVDVAKIMIGTGSACVDATKVVAGTGSGLVDVWTSASPKRMGMTLGADFTPGSIGTSYWFTPTGFVARTGFPDTVLPSSGVFNLSAGTYKIATRVVRTQDYQSRGIRVKDAGGNVLATIQDQYFNPNELVNVTFTHPGGLLTVEIMNESSFNNAHIIRAGTQIEVLPSTWPTLQGVIKSGAQSISSGAYALITMTVADPQHPGTTITTNGFTVVGDGPVTVNAYARMIDSNTSGNKIQVYKNGSPISGAEFTQNPAALGTQWGGSFTHTFANGDLVQLFGWTTGIVSNRREFSGDGTKANTYLELMP